MTCFEKAWNENIYDVAAAQFMIHVTMDFCSASPAVKGCLGGLRKILVQDITCCSIRRRCLAIERASRRPALESAVDMEIATSACPLACWSDNAANFLLLAAQAKHFLGAPHTSVATEHLFSSAVNI